MTTGSVTTLYRPVGQAELDKIRDSGWRRFPPRFGWQPIFYPVLTEAYAVRIAREWNTQDKDSGHVGYVTRFRVRTTFLAQFPVQTVGGSQCQEYWIPAEQLDAFNDNVVGLIEVLHTFGDSGTGAP